ncbi:amidohydrolase family protein [Pseudoalteromonas byunsanensis]|uniref:amidohydrolase family protein n=1 Tax=Pseudoalteromonas byunsanensis TaxID=327939 RepID=UPI0011139722
MAITANPAQILGLNKGTIKINSDADLVLLDKQTLAPLHIWSNGLHMVENAVPIIKGLFE